MQPTERNPIDGPEGYEPPAVDEVLSADDLAREVHYAGTTGSAGPVG